jgi:LysR family glycine cleavage system transcriptional activator
MPGLPNLSALRAFEAAARHQNFSRAAEELHVTHGAISHQVRALEDQLGLPLFVRNGRNVRLNPDGARFAQAVESAFAQIAAAAEQLRPPALRRRLTVSSIPSFAARWLAPRLPAFIALHPDIEVVLQSSGQLQDLAREGIDVGIRFGGGDYPGLLSERLMGDVYYPVVSPRYRDGRLPATPAALAEAALLRSDEPWLPWFKAAGLDWSEPAGGLTFQDQTMLIRCALDGNGVALVRHAMVAPEIASGELVRLFDISLPSAAEYFFVSPPEAARRSQVKAFKRWMLDEIAR